jgi:hypothetical protein
MKTGALQKLVCAPLDSFLKAEPFRNLLRDRLVSQKTGEHCLMGTGGKEVRELS